MKPTFESLGIRADLVHALREMEIAEPTPIQAEAIPVIAAGKDVVAQSQTGTGKTLAYLLPVVQKLDPQLKGLQAVVLVPTRELCMQILREAEVLTAGSGLTVQALIGGVPVARQLDRLKLHPQLIVGTPGRVLELIKLRKLKMNAVRSIVVDEADQVFELGSMTETENIVRSALRDRQLIFFSATMPEGIGETIGRWANDPEEIKIEPTKRLPEQVEHLYFQCEPRDKVDMLRRIVRLLNPKAALVFVNETEDIAEIVAKMQYVGLSIEALYGESDKTERARVLKGFREGRFQLLLATDVAARGLDIKGLTHVIHFDLPIDADHYVHRAGRTGRMGRKGTSVSIVTPREQFIIDKFERTLGISIEQKAMYRGALVAPEAPRDAAKAGQPGESPARPRAEGQRKGAPAAAQAGDASGSQPARRQESAPGASPAGRRSAVSGSGQQKQRSQRDRDRKNKGAPKWLKEKQSPVRPK